jgi:hypothetical protein
MGAEFLYTHTPPRLSNASHCPGPGSPYSNIIPLPQVYHQKLLRKRTGRATTTSDQVSSALNDPEPPLPLISWVASLVPAPMRVQAIPGTGNKMIRALNRNRPEGGINIHEQLHSNRHPGNDGPASLAFLRLHILTTARRRTVSHGCALGRINNNVRVPLAVSTRSSNTPVSGRRAIRGRGHEVTIGSTQAEHAAPERIGAPDVGAARIDARVPLNDVLPRIAKADGDLDALLVLGLELVHRLAAVREADFDARRRCAAVPELGVDVVERGAGDTAGLCDAVAVVAVFDCVSSV